MTRPAPTSSASSTSPRATRSAAILLDVVRRTAEVCFMPLTVGGGVRTLEDIRALLLAGADKVSINTAAVRDREFVARGGREIRQPMHRRRDRCQADRARDAGRSSPMAAATPTGLDAVAYAREAHGDYGAGEILLTSMDRDGTKAGFDLALTRAVADAVPVPVIASGGVGTLDHLVDGVREGHASAVLAASIFHFGESTIAEAKARLAEAGLPVRRA